MIFLVPILYDNRPVSSNGYCILEGVRIPRAPSSAVIYPYVSLCSEFRLAFNQDLVHKMPGWFGIAL